MPPPGQHRPWMIDEQFRRWVMVPVSMPSVPEDLHAALSEPQDLPEMIEIVREAEIACMGQLQECNRQTRPARELADTGEWARTIQLLVRHREVMEWEMRIKWLQDVRRHLEKKHRRSEIACAAL
jgi:hypothetical protein